MTCHFRRNHSKHWLPVASMSTSQHRFFFGLTTPSFEWFHMVASLCHYYGGLACLMRPCLLPQSQYLQIIFSIQLDERSIPHNIKGHSTIIGETARDISPITGSPELSGANEHDIGSGVCQGSKIVYPRTGPEKATM